MEDALEGLVPGTMPFSEFVLRSCRLVESRRDALRAWIRRQPLEKLLYFEGNQGELDVVKQHADGTSRVVVPGFSNTSSVYGGARVCDVRSV